MDRSSILRASTKKENVELFFAKNGFALVYSFDMNSTMYRLGSTYVVLLFLFTLLGLAKAGFTESTSRVSKDELIRRPTPHPHSSPHLENQ